jgi:hypothetical protein
VKAQSGQALVETALTLPLLILLALVVIAIMIQQTAQQKLSAATALAASAAASSPADPVTSRRWAEQSYDGTISGYAYLEVDALDSRSPFSCRRDNPAQTRIRCHGHATLLLQRTPLAILLVSLPLDAYAEADAPLLRSR